MKHRVLLLLAAVALFGPLLSLVVGESRLGRALERRVYDSWFTIRGVLERPQEVVVIAIDVDSEQALGRYPWSRDWHTVLIRNLHRAGASVVAFDATFADAFPVQDSLMRRAIDETGIVVLGAKTNVIYGRNATGGGIEEPAGVLQGSPIGIVDILTDAMDGVIREYPILHRYARGPVPQLGVQALMVHLDLPLESLRETEQGWHLADRFIPQGPGGGMLINFIGPAGSVATYSYADVVDDFETDIGEWDLDAFEDLLAEGRFEGRIVLVGSTVPEHQDLHATPFRDMEGSSGSVRTPGVEIHAHAVATILDSRHLRPLPRSVQYAWTFLLGIGAIVAVAKLRFITGAAVGFALGIAALVGSWLFFSLDGSWLWAVAPLLSTGVSYAGASGVLYFTEEQEKARIRGMFQQYVASSVVDELIRRPELLALGGEERVVSVLFSDVVGFSGVSEQVTPTQLVALLNEYLTAMTDIVLEHRGIIDKYIGDALMAEFGAPVPVEDHARLACVAAVRMQQELVRLRKGWEAEGKPLLRANVGVNTGMMLVGNLGSSRIMDYTVMGDNVNLASRLEGTNRTYKTDIMVSEMTWKEVEGHFVGRELDWIRVKGRDKGVGVYEIIATADDGVPSEVTQMLRDYEAALAIYRSGRFEDALAAFRRIAGMHPDDGPTQLLLARCEEYLAHPPAAGWDGVYVMTSK